LNNLGDYLHYDGLASVTPASGHVLDADSRYPKVFEVGARILRNVARMLLTKHEKVIFQCVGGNHDPSSAVAIRACFKMHYEDDPRIDVLDSEQHYHAFEFGDVMLAFHHGHLKKMDKLRDVYADMFSAMWGRTKYRYGHSGHLHFYRSFYDSGMKLTQHPTIAAADSYSAQYFPGSPNQEMIAHTYHRYQGEILQCSYRPTLS
jgi:hypothetical protein